MVKRSYIRKDQDEYDEATMRLVGQMESPKNDLARIAELCSSDALSPKQIGRACERVAIDGQGALALHIVQHLRKMRISLGSSGPHRVADIVITQQGSLLTPDDANLALSFLYGNIRSEFREVLRHKGIDVH